jgi:hypothetical protein
VNGVRAAVGSIRARPGTVAIVCLGLAWGFAMHSMGWAQLAHFAQVRAFDAGQAEIDPWHWETGDKAWIDGHFYSVKSPGVAALSLPLYQALDTEVGRDLASTAITNARRTAHPRWAADERPNYELYGYDPVRAMLVQARIERNAPVVWALTLLVAVVPAVLLLLGVRRVADRLEPGYGTAAAVSLGLGTVLMIFAAEYFSHVIAAALGFAAFAVLMRERRGPPRLASVALAGLLAGLGVTFEFQVGLVGLILFFYALARSARWLPRAAAYATGAVAGALPALAFNTWALGAPFELAYSEAVAELGRTGHEELGLNSDGFFGITLPRADAAIELLLANRGLLVLTPILVMAVVGVVLMRRRGHRAEANVIASVAIAYFVYNSGYWQPFGGGTPGPRFLIPGLPFLAIGLAFAYRTMPALTLALAIPSAVAMLTASLTYPLLGEQGTGTWVEWLSDGSLEHTLLTAAGVSDPWLATVPLLAAIAFAIAFAVRATPSTPLGSLAPALAALGIWVIVAVLGPSIAGDEATPLGGDTEALALVGAGATLSLVTLALLRLRERRPQPLGEPPRRPALSEPIS